MQRIDFIAMTAALALLAASGCKAAPRTRPVEMGPVDTGPASVEAVRRQLQGTWELTGLELFSPTGERIAAEARGRLQYDEFGNLSMQGTITGGPDIDSSVLNLTGRVVVDPVGHTLQFRSVTAATSDEKRLDPQLDARHVRHYEFAGDLLRITIKAADGATTSTATWKKIG
jgi:hypothetical protein